MNKKIVLGIFLLLLGIVIGTLMNKSDRKETISFQPTPTIAVSKTNCIGDGCLLDGVDFPIQELPEDIEQSLLKGLDDEYKAYATYRAIMDTYGNIRPFVMIARAEQQHIVSLQGLFEKYGIEIPGNPYLGKVEVPGSVQGACALGVTGEIENVALYKEVLLPLVRMYPDITQVYTNLMNASEQKHLPAFERCD